MNILKPTFKIIVAYDQNRGIGNHNQLVWNNPNDKKFFRNITKNADLIIGRKTFESIYKQIGTSLNNRLNIVLTSDKKYNQRFNSLNCNNCVAIDDIEIIKQNISTAYVIGGESIYKQFLDISNEVYATKIKNTFDCDSFFPKLNKNIWRSERLESHKDFNIVRYTRKG